MSFYSENVPLVDAAAFNLPAGTTVPHDTDTSFGAFLRPTSDTGNWVSGSTLKYAARAGLVILSIGEVATAATAFKLSLLEGDDADGTSGAEKTVLSSLDNTALGTGNKTYKVAVSFAALDEAKFYALGACSKGPTPATDGVPCSATMIYLDPVYSK